MLWSGAHLKTEDKVRQEDRSHTRKVRYWIFWKREVTEWTKVDVQYKEDVVVVNPGQIKVHAFTD